MISLAIIPARGGSKSVPKKNIRILSGKPLIFYTIASAFNSNELDRVIVSTDDKKIAKIALEFGAEVIIRPPELATEEAPTEWALLHVLDELKSRENYDPDIVLTLEPTSPLRTPELIDQCIKMFKSTEADSVIGVVETRSCYGRIFEGRFEFLFPNQPRRRQERKPLYKESSTIYGTKVNVLRRKKSVLGDRLYPLIVPEREALDINTLLDFVIAEAVILWNRQGGQLND